MALLSGLLLLSPQARGQQDEPAKNPPMITSPGAVFDFGITTNKPSISHTFVLKNEGGAELVINQVKPSCGCTTASLTKKNLQPGEEVEVAATLSLKGRKGKQRKTITVTSNDPKNPRFLLQIVGTVHQEVSLIPRQVVFRFKPGTVNPAREVRLRFNTPNPVTLAGIETNGAPCCSVSLKEETQGKDYKLSLKLRADYQAPASLRESAFVEVLTDLPSNPRIRIPIQIQVDRDIVVAPSQITLMPSKDVFSQQLLVRDKRSRKIEVLDLKASFGNITFNTVKMTDSMHRIAIKVKAPDQSMNGKAITLRVKDSQGVEYSIQIPVRVAGGVITN